MQFCRLFYFVFLTIQSLSAQQSSWFAKSKVFLTSQKQALTRAFQAALRRPSIPAAIAAVGSALYATAPKARAETIFIARDKQGNIRDITPEEHEKLYDIKLKSQFPTAQCYTDYDPTANETEVIQKKVDATFGDKKIEAVWTPDTVYGLAGIDQAGVDFSYGRKIPQTVGDICKVNNDPDVKRLDLNINNALIKELKNSIKNPVHPTIQDWKHVAQNYLQIPQNMYHQAHQGLINNSIEAEGKAHHNKEFLLWRGVGKTNEFQLIDKPLTSQYEALKHSLSYGSSLFAGCWYDPDACAFKYIDRPKAFGYVLPFSKKKYMDAGKNHAMYVPPISQAGSLLSKGEIFHPRLKFSENIKKNRYGDGYISSEQKMATIFRSNRQAKIRDFLQYLSRYHQPLKSTK